MEVVLDHGRPVQVRYSNDVNHEIQDTCVNIGEVLESINNTMLVGSIIKKEAPTTPENRKRSSSEPISSFFKKQRVSENSSLGKQSNT